PDLRDDDAIAALRAAHGVADHPTFLYLGRGSFEKSLPLCLEAVRRVLADASNARFVLICDGPDVARSRGLVRSPERGSQVVLLGAVAHEELMAQSLPRLGDVFITASETENQPVSLLEAMAFGLPVIGPRARGIPELVEHGRNGLLF